MPAMLLSLRGRATLYREGARHAVVCRYRKGLALLAFLARHPGRVQRRETLACLLWPDLESAAGRANLRVVLADLAAVLRLHGLADLLEVQRDTLAWNPAGRLVLDLDWLAAATGRLRGAAQALPAFEAESEFLAAEALQGVWLAGAEEGSSDEFVAWIEGERAECDAALLEIRRLRQEAADSATAAAAPVPAVSVLPGPSAGPAGAATASYTTLTLLRVEVAEVAAADDQPWMADMASLLAGLQAEAARFEGRLLGSDDVGCTFCFGMHSHHTGQRWQALRCAAALAARHPGLLRTGVTAGRVLLKRTPSPHAIGWRMRLVDRLAQRAEAGEVACDESMSDLAAYLGFRLDGIQRFRGLDRSFLVYRHALPTAQALERMLPPPGDFAQGHFGRAALLQTLVADFDRPADAAPGVWCLHGAPGMGKTRTAWECAQRLRQRGRSVFWMTARPEGRDMPWYGLRELARALVAAGSPGEGLSPQAWQALCAFADVGLDGSARIDPLAAAMAHLLRGGPAGQGAALVVVDDADWLDTATAGLLQCWARLPGVHWLLTCRGALPEPLAGLPVQMAPLEPLDDGLADAILVSLPGGAALAPAARRGRIASARGIPLYLLADVVSSRQGSHFGDFCSARFDALDDCGSTLLAAAVLGMLFSCGDLAVLCGEPAAREAVARATAAGLLLPRGNDTAAFFHARLRTHLLETAPREALLGHALAAAALRSDQGLHAQAAMLLEMAGEPRRASRTWFRAALHALAVNDLDAALEYCDRMSRTGSLAGAHGARAHRLQTLCLVRLLAPASAAPVPAADLRGPDHLDHPDARGP